MEAQYVRLEGPEILRAYFLIVQTIAIFCIIFFFLIFSSLGDPGLFSGFDYGSKFFLYFAGYYLALIWYVGERRVGVHRGAVLRHKRLFY